MCKKCKTQKLYAKFIDHCHEIDPEISAEKLIHMDISGEKNKIYAIGCCLATLTEANYSKKSDHNFNDTSNLKITLTNYLTTFKLKKRTLFQNT